MIQRNGLCFALVAGLFALGCGAGDLGEGTGADGEVADLTAPGVDEQGLPLPSCLPPSVLSCTPSGCTCKIPTNLSVNRPSVQSSLVPGFDAVAARANDGNTDGNFWNGSVSHTNIEPAPYWYVDLGAEKTITQVRIFNRTDCCSERLSHYNVWAVINGAWQVVSNHENENTTGVPAITVNFSSLKTRYVMIRKTDTNYLHLAEVQVMGF